MVSASPAGASAAKVKAAVKQYVNFIESPQRIRIQNLQWHHINRVAHITSSKWSMNSLNHEVVVWRSVVDSVNSRLINRCDCVCLMRWGADKQIVYSNRWTKFAKMLLFGDQTTMAMAYGVVEK